MNTDAKRVVIKSSPVGTLVCKEISKQCARPHYLDPGDIFLTSARKNQRPPPVSACQNYQSRDQSWPNFLICERDL